MNTVQSSVNIIADFLNKRETSAGETVFDWEEIAAIFKKHEMSGVLYTQCAHLLPDSIKPELARQFHSTIFYYSQRTWLENEIRKLLDSKGIPYFTVKGSEVARFYPRPALRTIGDTDLIVHTEDRSQVHELLMQMGFLNESRPNEGAWIYYKNSLELELHDRLVYSGVVNQKLHADFFNDCWRYVNDNHLNWSFHFLFILLHLRKHFMYTGVGFRQFVDIAVLTKSNKDLDWAWIEEKLHNLDLWNFAQRVFALNQKWFGIAPPLKIDRIDDLFLEEATEQICYNGLFGNDNDDNLGNAMVNRVANSEISPAGMVRSVFADIFLSYDRMKTMRQYRYLSGKSYLLPIAWIHRAGRTLAQKRAGHTIKKIVKTSFVTKKKIDQRSEQLEKWGL